MKEIKEGKKDWIVEGKHRQCCNFVFCFFKKATLLRYD